MEIVSSSESQTQKIGEDFAKTLKPGDVVALFGTLGAGKTVFVKAVAAALGIKKLITSPTFTFVKTYKKGNIVLHHIDLYRAKDTKDLEALGLPEIFTKDAIVVLEWADRIKHGLPKNRWEVYIRVENESTRKIKITRLG